MLNKNHLFLTTFVQPTEREEMKPPKFVERIQNYVAREGEPVTLTCHAVGTPTPMMSWQKDNRTVVPNREYRYDIYMPIL